MLCAALPCEAVRCPPRPHCDPRTLPARVDARGTGRLRRNEPFVAGSFPRPAVAEWPPASRIPRTVSTTTPSARAMANDDFERAVVGTARDSRCDRRAWASPISSSPCNLWSDRSGWASIRLIASESALVQTRGVGDGQMEVAIESADLSAWPLFVREPGSSQKDKSSVRARSTP